MLTISRGLPLNEELKTILKDYSGIIGSIIGVIVGFLLSKFSNLLGRTYFFINSLSFTPKYRGEFGETNDKELEESNYIEFILIFDLLNNSESKKIMRNIKIKFKNNKFEQVFTPKNSETKLYKSHIITIEDFSLMNLEPKTVYNINLEYWIEIDKQKLELYKNAKIYIQFFRKNIMFNKKIANIVDSKIIF